MKIFDSKRMNSLMVGLLTVLLASACETNSGSVVESPPQEVQRATFTPFKTDPKLVDIELNGTEEEKAYVQNLSLEASNGISAARAAIRGNNTWQEVDLAVREELTRFEEHPMRQKVEQLVAHTMLRERLLSTETSEEKLEAVGFYTRLLVDNDNPDAAVVLPALQALDGYWTGDEVASYAEKSSQLAEAWLDRNFCEECVTKGAGKNATTNEALDARQRRAYQIQSAVPELEALASADGLK